MGIRKLINSASAPDAIGSYSHAVRVDQTVYLSGQIPLDPATMLLVSGDFETEARQVFANIAAVAKDCGGSLDACVKLTIYLVELHYTSVINQLMQELFTTGFPARTTIEVSGLPKGARVEIDAILVLD